MINDISRLDYFTLNVMVELCEHKSVTVAAVRLQVSQSKVSRALTCLREVFGDPLFVRQRYGMEPNRLAETIYPLAKSVVSRYQVLARTAANSRLCKHEVNIAAQEHLSSVLMDCLHNSRIETESDLTFNLHPWTSDVQNQMNQSKLDYCISINPAESENVDLHQIGQIRSFYLVAKKGHPIFDRPLGIDNLFSYPVALFYYSMNGPKNHRLETIATELKQPLSVSMKTTNLCLLLEHLEKTECVGFLASVLVLEAIDERGTLDYIDMTDFWKDKVKHTGERPKYNIYLQSNKGADSIFTNTLVENLRTRILSLQA